MTMSLMMSVAAAVIAVASVSGAPGAPVEGATVPPSVGIVEPAPVVPEEPSAGPSEDSEDTPDAAPAPDASAPDEIQGAGPDVEEAPAASEDDGTQAPHERGVAGLPVCGPYTPIGEGCYSDIIGGGVWQWEDGSVTYTWDDGRMITIFPDGGEKRSGDWSGHRMPWDEKLTGDAVDTPEAAPGTQSDMGLEAEVAAEGTQSDTLVDGKQSLARTELAATGSEHVLIGVAVAVALVCLGVLALWVRRPRPQWVAVGEPEDGAGALTFADWEDFLRWVDATWVCPVIEETGDWEYANRIIRACNMMVVTQGEDGWQEMANLTGVRVYPIS